MRWQAFFCKGVYRPPQRARGVHCTKTAQHLGSLRTERKQMQRGLGSPGKTRDRSEPLSWSDHWGPGLPVFWGGHPAAAPRPSVPTWGISRPACPLLRGSWRKKPGLLATPPLPGPGAAASSSLLLVFPSPSSSASWPYSTLFLGVSLQSPLPDMKCPLLSMSSQVCRLLPSAAQPSSARPGIGCTQLSVALPQLPAPPLPPPGHSTLRGLTVPCGLYLRRSPQSAHSLAHGCFSA